MFDRDVGPNWHLRFRLKLEEATKGKRISKNEKIDY